MCFCTDNRLCVFLVLIFCAGVSKSEGRPLSPKIFYAVTSSTAEIPCVVDSSKDRLRWYPEHPSQASSRTSSHTDPDDPELFVYIIRNVQPSDAGRYICNDGRYISKTELVVIEPSYVRDTEAHTSGPDEIKVKWKAPPKNPEAVSGYNIYVTEVAATGKEVKITVDTVSHNGIEEFPLTDFSPGATFNIQVAPLYLKGSDDIGETTEGPRSPIISITTPEFEAAPWKINAEPGANSTILVTWRTPREEEARGVDGYIVYYQGVVKKDAPSGEVTASLPDKGSRGSAVLKGLKLRQKYRIWVAAYTGGSRKIVGRSSEEVVFTHDGFNPELSIRAVALSPDTVLVSLNTVGGNKVDKLRVLFSDDSAIKWDKVEGYNAKEMYAVVTGLQPRTRYFFMAKAAVNKKARSVVTHVFTPPADLATATNVTVTARSDSSVQVTWDYDDRRPVKGFIVLVDKMDPTGSFSPDKHRVVVKENEALVQGLEEDEKYLVKVEPFDVESVGACSDPVLFQLSVYGPTTPPAPENTPPRFVNDLPEELQINAGEEIRLDCTAIGTPRPVVQWFSDNNPVTQPAEHFSELVLSGVTDDVSLTCRATNSEGSVERQTQVHVTREVEEPKFVERLPETLIVARGAEVSQVCEATGFPVPTVTWYKNGAPVQPGSPARGVFVERRAVRNFELKCVARNELGWTESVIQVYIQDTLRRPALRQDLPRSVEKQEGDELTIPCMFNGFPIPQVSWYDGSTRLAEPNLGQNNLRITSVDRSTILTCKGENLAGTTDAEVTLRVVKPEVTTPEPTRSSDYKVILREVIESPSDVKVKWFVETGDLNQIRLFDIKLLNDVGQTLLHQVLNPQQRSMNFRRLSPQNRYTVNLQTLNNRGVVVDRSSLSFSTQETTNSNEPTIYLDVVEVRDTNARLDYSTRNIDPRRHHSYRLLVKDLGARALGNTILTKDGLQVNTSSITLEWLKPYSYYQVIIDALSREGAPFLTASANFSTPGVGQYGAPVSVTSAPPTNQPPSRNTQPQRTTPARPTPPVITRRTRPTPAPRTRSTAPTLFTTSTVYTTTPEIDTTTTYLTTPEIDTTTTYLTTPEIDTTTESQENHDYVMTAKIPNKTPFKVDIRWTVDRGPLENVKNFTVTIKGVRGQTLLQQTLPENQRYITIQSLNPDTKYFVNVKANGPEGVLVESDVDFQTAPADVLSDISNPTLELEANEVRDETARIDWTVVKADPDLVKGYRLQVLDGGPGGFNLLSQKLQANSQSLNLQQLQPSKRYHVIVDALAADDSVLMTSSLTFETAAANRYGLPVFSSSSPQARSSHHPRELTRVDSPREGSAPAEGSDPTLDLTINPEGSSSTGLSWSMRNVAPGSVSWYKLMVLNNGPGGNVLLEKLLPVNYNSFKLDGLVTNRRYYVQLDATSSSGVTVLRAATVYTPGRSVTPLQVSSTPAHSGPAHERSPAPDGQGREDSRVADEPKPELEFELNPVGEEEVKVNWTLTGDSRTRPVSSYRVKVHINGPEGQVLHESDLRTNTIYYTISGLQENTRYHIRLEALDKDGRLIQHVGSPYLLPPPGFPVAPIRTSSALNQKPAGQSTTPSGDRGPQNSELVITKAVPEGQNAILLEWYDVTSDSGRTARNTMVRYAVFKDDVRDQYQIQSVPTGQQRLVIRNLNASTTYGIQVASMATGGQFMRWSKLVLVKTA